MSDKSNKYEFIHKALNERKAEHKLRSLSVVDSKPESNLITVDGNEYINFSSNDYLGLSTNSELIKRSEEYSKSYGTGSGASRLITGTLAVHEQLEQDLADQLGTEAALLFNSGFQANTSILPAIADRNSLIVADKNIHNSLIQGALLSNATFKRFKHNDYEHLELILKDSTKESYNRILIVSETVFSMDGDRSDIDKLEVLSNTYNALLYSDDAHALGVLGEKGLGLNYGHQGIDISLGTFGKSFGSFGAFVACSKLMKEYLVNYASGFIYSTALPPNVVGAIQAGLELIPSMNKEREELLANVDYLRSNLNELGFNTLGSDSQIIPVLIGSESETIDLSNALKEKGLWVSSIRPPTVEKDSSRLRITLSVKHSRPDIDKLLEVLTEWKRK